MNTHTFYLTIKVVAITNLSKADAIEQVSSNKAHLIPNVDDVTVVNTEIISVDEKYEL